MFKHKRQPMFACIKVEVCIEVLAKIITRTSVIFVLSMLGRPPARSALSSSFACFA